MHTPDHITKLPKNCIFVFGSNRAGQHIGGAARLAHEKFGAEMCVGEGLTGQSYAFPTLDKNMQPVTAFDLLKSKMRLYSWCWSHPEKTFYLTKVGCGIAGFKEEDMQLVFADNVSVLNLIRPKNW